MINNDYEGSRGELVRLLAEQGEEPAFVRRHRRLQESIRGLETHVLELRELELRVAKDLLGILGEKVAENWSKLSKYLVNPAESSVFEMIWSDLRIADDDRIHPYADQWLWSIHRTLRKFSDAVEVFNQRWESKLRCVKLEKVNQLIEQYNEYYPLEKSCAFGIEDIERLGFEPAEPICIGQLVEKFPKLHCPQLRSTWRVFA